MSKIEVIDNKKFIEYTRDEYSTTFSITAFEASELYEFDMENDNMVGHWRGIFSFAHGRTILDFTEEVTAKKWFLKPFVGIYLKRQQKQYANDLRKAIENFHKDIE